MKIARILFVLAFFLATLRAAETPEDVAVKQIAATKAANWEDYTACMHPKALTHFKDSMVPVGDAAVAADTPAAKRILDRVFANQDVGKLKSAPPAEYFKTFMQNWSAKNPGFVQTMKSAKIQMLGHANESDTQVHVVYRTVKEARGSKITNIDVVSLEKDGDKWKCMLSDELENLASNLLLQLRAK